MRAVALSYLALDLLALGFPTQARRWNREAVAWARTLSHPHTLAFTLHYSAIFHLIAGDALLAEQAIDELRALAGEHRFSVWLAGADAMRGCLLASRGADAEGFALARDGLAGRTASGSIYHQTFFLGLLGDRCGRVGELDEAHGLLGAAIAIASDIGERWFEAELHRLKGEFLLALSEPDRPEAEACLQRALAIARAQGARTWELRAASSLARLWWDQGRQVEAHDLLAPICDWFTEGFDVPELVEAKRLID
jgi:predicted ATPase